MFPWAGDVLVDVSRRAVAATGLVPQGLHLAKGTCLHSPLGSSNLSFKARKVSLRPSGDQDKSQGLLWTPRTPHPSPPIDNTAVSVSRLILDSPSILFLLPNLSPASPSCADVGRGRSSTGTLGVPFTRPSMRRPSCYRNSEVASRSSLST